MIIAIITLVLAVFALVFLKTAKNMNLKAVGLVLVLLMFGTTLGICIMAPKMHKEFSISVIDYLIKFNDDGSMSTTKQTTQTIRQKQQQGVQK